jgi:hypothetical protein
MSIKTIRLKEIKSDDEDQDFVLLNKNIIVKISKFRNNLRIDIRRYYQKKKDRPILTPSKQGISLDLKCWEELKNRINAIDNKISNYILK